MSFFTMDESEVKTGGGLIKEGDYEVIITSAESKTATTGKDMITVDYEVRSDIEQEYQGWKLRFNNFTIESTNKFTNQLLYSCGWSVKEGNPPNFKDLKDMAQQLVGKTLSVHVKHEKDDKGQTWGRAKFTNRSRVKGDAAPSNTNTQNNKGPIEVSEDDLPF